MKWSSIKNNKKRIKNKSIYCLQQRVLSLTESSRKRTSLFSITNSSSWTIHQPSIHLQLGNRSQGSFRSKLMSIDPLIQLLSFYQSKCYRNSMWTNTKGHYFNFKPLCGGHRERVYILFSSPLSKWEIQLPNWWWSRFDTSIPVL